jgi:AhpD family alkylhydroperoxidase
MKEFMGLDYRCYQAGALGAKTKELMGLVASLVLRCDDCINYHIGQCLENGVTDDEFIETMTIGLIVGGSITIPHIRRAIEVWDSERKTQ